MQGPPPTIVEWMILPWVLGKCITKENTVKSVLTPVVLLSITEAERYSREFCCELLTYQNRLLDGMSRGVPWSLPCALF